MRKLSLQSVRFGALFLFIFFIFPVLLRVAFSLFEDDSAVANSPSVGVADKSSIGLLPPPGSHPAARVLVMSFPLPGYRGKFATHASIVLKRKNACSWEQYQVLPHVNGHWSGSKPILNRYENGRSFERPPIVIADVVGATAEEAIPKIEVMIENAAATQRQYRFWPGPNSNTFVAAAIRAAPELKASLPPSAVGKDFKFGFYAGLTDSQTGVEATLFGILGVKIGWVEGVEINILTLIAGFDVRQPALKIPGFGRIDLAKNESDNMTGPQGSAELANPPPCSTAGLEFPERL